MNAIIRRPQTNEKEEIHALFDKTIRRTLALEGVEDEFELTEMLIKDQQELINLDFDTLGEQCYFLVAVLDGRIIGTICLRPCSDIIRECADRDAKDMLEIGSVYVLPQFQGRGIAKQLLFRIYQTLRERGANEFWLDSGYDVAKKVWRNVLGTPTVIMKDYWEEGVDHHLWYRKLSEVDVENKG